MKRFAGAAVVLGLLGLVAAFVLWWLPADDFLFVPDRAKPLADKVEVEGGKANAEGDVYYVDLFVRRIRLLEQLLPFTRPEGSTLVSEEILAPTGESDAERNRQNAADMVRSEETAAVVALRELGYDVVATPRGVLVTTVSPDVPAAATLDSGDVIVAVDGTPVKTPAELRAQIGRRKPGDDVRLTLRRGEKAVEVTVRTIASPEDPSKAIVGILVDQDARIELPFDVDIDLGRVGGPSAGLPVRARDREAAGSRRDARLPHRSHRSARPRRDRHPDRRREAEDHRRAPGGCGLLPRPRRRERGGCRGKRRWPRGHPCREFSTGVADTGNGRHKVLILQALRRC